MKTDDFRVENKNNVWYGGQKTTLFTLFEREGDCYICRGNFATKGFGASDKKCITAAIAAIEAADYRAARIAAEAA